MPFNPSFDNIQSNTSNAELVQAFQDRAVMQTTINKYRPFWDGLDKWLQARNEPDVTENNMGHLIEWIMTDKNHKDKDPLSYLKTMRQAIAFRHTNRTDGRPRVSESPGWTKCWKGAIYNGKKPHAWEDGEQAKLELAFRGAVTGPLLTQFKKFVATQVPGKFNPKVWLDAIDTIVGAALRKEEFMTIKVRDFNPDTSMLHLNCNKAANASNGLPHHQDIPVLLPLAAEALERNQQRRRAEGAKEEDLLFPRRDAPADQLGEMVKLAADCLGWDTIKLKFDGIHCLRHGGIQMLKANEQLFEADAILRAAHSSKSCIQRYLLPNEERPGQKRPRA